MAQPYQIGADQNTRSPSRLHSLRLLDYHYILFLCNISLSYVISRSKSLKTENAHVNTLFGWIHMLYWYHLYNKEFILQSY